LLRQLRLYNFMTDYINSCIDLNYDYTVIADNSADSIGQITKIREEILKMIEGNQEKLDEKLNEFEKAIVDWKGSENQITKIKNEIKNLSQEQLDQLESRLKKFEESNNCKPALSYLKVDDDGYSYTISYSTADLVTK